MNTGLKETMKKNNKKEQKLDPIKLKYLKTKIVKNHKCSECNISYSRSDYLRDHIIAQHYGVMFSCDCGAKFGFRNLLRRHLVSGICANCQHENQLLCNTCKENSKINNAKRQTRDICNVKKTEIYNREVNRIEAILTKNLASTSKTRFKKMTGK